MVPYEANNEINKDGHPKRAPLFEIEISHHNEPRIHEELSKGARTKDEIPDKKIEDPNFKSSLVSQMETEDHKRNTKSTSGGQHYNKPLLLEIAVSSADKSMIYKGV